MAGRRTIFRPFSFLLTARAEVKKEMKVILGGVNAAVEAFEKTLGYASTFGKLWYLTVAFRVMITLLVGTSLYANHESTFRWVTTFMIKIVS